MKIIFKWGDVGIFSSNFHHYFNIGWGSEWQCFVLEFSLFNHGFQIKVF